MRMLVFGHWLEILLIGLGVIFLVGWVVAYRFRYAYVGCLGICLLLGGIKRAFTFASGVETALFVLVFVSAGYTVILMGAHSASNLQAARAAREERVARLARDLKDLLETPAKPGDGEEDA